MLFEYKQRIGDKDFRFHLIGFLPIKGNLIEKVVSHNLMIPHQARTKRNDNAILSPPNGLAPPSAATSGLTVSSKLSPVM